MPVIAVTSHVVLNINCHLNLAYTLSIKISANHTTRQITAPSIGLKEKKRYTMPRRRIFSYQ
jgi:hypothetical protein